MFVSTVVYEMLWYFAKRTYILVFTDASLLSSGALLVCHCPHRMLSSLLLSCIPYNIILVVVVVVVVVVSSVV